MTRALLSAACLTLLLSSCRDSEITVDDLLRAQDIVPFLVELPADLDENDAVGLELFGEEGAVDTTIFAQGLKPKETLKIFIHRKDDGYRLSVLTESGAANDIKMNYGKRELRVYRGNSRSEVFKVGDPLAGFTIDDSVSYMNPRGDDLSLRVIVENGGEQGGARQPATRPDSEPRANEKP